MATMNIFTNANVYVAGESRIGQCAEFQCPTVKNKLQEVAALGLTAPMNIPVSLEAMEATMKFAGLYKDTMKLVADPYKNEKYMLRGNFLEVDGDGVKAQKPYKVELMASCTEFNSGAAKMGEDPGMEVKMNVTYFKLNIDGDDIIEVDTVNNMYLVAGVDKLAPYKGNLGI